METFSLISHAFFMLMISKTLISTTTLVDSATDEDALALLAFKNGINSAPNSILSSNWSTNTSPCDWAGVACAAANRRVTALNLSGLALAGNLTPHLGNLSFLQFLDLSSNNFAGALPSEISKCRRLEVINVGFNDLTGEIPPWIGALAQLRHLRLNNNKFSGKIPIPLFNLSDLLTLNLGYNFLDGSVSDQIGGLSSLTTLKLAGNRFSGGVPRGIFTNMSSVIEIDMSDNQLAGELPSDMCGGGNPHLRRLNLTENQLDGEIPAAIYKCAKLEELRLHFNKFSGKIPSGIGNLTMLRLLDLYSNKLQGSIPEDIGQLASLGYLIINGNNLTGRIPKQVGNLTSLIWLDLASNKLTGELPEELGNLAQLMTFGAPFNDFLNGSIPPSIFNLSNLKTLGLQQNQFSGTLPPNMGDSLVNLQKLYLYFNRLTGKIPSSITNASQLTVIELNKNSFTGSIPDFGNLRQLRALRLWENNLTGAESPNQELTFLSSLTNCRDLEVLEILHNPMMNGILPASIGNLSATLVRFLASNCSIRGVIPSEIGNLSSLQVLNLSNNKLRGSIPTTMGKLEQLVELYLYGNQLQGYIPRELCQINNLGELYLSSNMLAGSIPECLGEIASLREVSLASNKLDSTLPSKFFNLKDLIFLYLSSNHLSGQLPDQIGNLKAISKMDLSHNNFSGRIPSTISGCQSLEFLYLSANMFDGSIPQAMGEVRGLIALDLSNNHLSGSVPESLTKLDLREFNVSYNGLEGEIPDKGCFVNFTATSFLHNSALCGPTRFQVSPCGERKPKSKSVWRVLKYVIPPFLAAVIVVVVVIVVLRGRSRKTPPPAEAPLVGVSWRIVSEREIKEGTDNFSEPNLLGRGGVGSVYKATLADGTQVAVKVFNLELEGATKSFETESRILSKIRHRNLVKILGCCSNTEFKALILAYIPNGSLDKWLYSDEYCLNLMQRLKIAIDVALALEYLHHDNTCPVVHCDIKPSNVLLDTDLTAHLGDFGISKLFDNGEAAVRTMSMATIGYAAPEFGSEGMVSTRGDVYSFGILLLEIFSGKKPTDDMFSGEMNIKEWVENALQENNITNIVAFGLLSREDPHFSAKLECVKSIFDLGVKCLAFSPEERINMMQLVASLQKIKAKVLFQ